MGEPAHDDLMTRDHLLAVNAQVLPATRIRTALRPPGDDQPPGDQRAGIARPTDLHGQQTQEVDVGPINQHLLTRCLTNRGRLHVPQRLDHVQQPACVLQPLGRLGLLEAGEHPTHIAQLTHLARTHAHGDPSGRAEQIGQRRHRVAALRIHGPLEPKRRPLAAQHAVAERSHVESRRDRFHYPPEFAFGLQPGTKLPEIAVLHRCISS